MLEVAFASDERFAPHMGVAIYSLLANTDEKDIIRVNVLDCGIGKENRSKLEGLARGTRHKIRWISCDMSLLGPFPVSPGYSMAVYARFLLPRLLPKTDKVLYLDGDVLVRGSLAGIFEVDMSDCLIAGVPDNVLWGLYRFRPQDLDIYYVGEDFNQMFARVDYFNSGVLLMNLELMRRTNFITHCLDLIDKRGQEIKNQDQDVINFVCAEKRRRLPFTYNTIALPSELFAPEIRPHMAPLLESCVIRHYAGPFKPWLRVGELWKWGFSGGEWGKMKDEYRRYMRLSPWPRVQSRWTFLQRVRRMARYMAVHPGCLFKPSFWRGASESEWEGIFM